MASRRTVLVAGACRRLDWQVAQAFIACGDDVIFHTDNSALAHFVAAARRRNTRGRAVLLESALNSAADAEALVRVARRAVRSARLAPLGALVIAAPQSSRSARTPLIDLSPADWQETLARALRIPFLMARRAGSLMAPRGGAIVFLLPRDAEERIAPVLRVAQEGCVTLTRALARALAPRVRVNAVLAGRGASAHALVAAVQLTLDAPSLTGQVLRV